MITLDSDRSTAVSTAVTTAGESSEPHGVCSGPDCAVHDLKSINPDLATSAPEPSYTQCRGNGLAPVSAMDDRPSANNVTANVVHTSGAANRTYGGREMRRGNGAPVRPPTVCVKHTGLVGHHRRGPEHRQPHRGDRHRLAAHPHLGDTDVQPAVLAVVDDPSVSRDLDPADQRVREPEPVRRVQRLHVVEHVRRRRVVVRHAGLEAELGCTRHRFGRDPGHCRAGA